MIISKFVDILEVTKLKEIEKIGRNPKCDRDRIKKIEK